MIEKSIIVAISANAAYNEAVYKFGWHCDQRTIPEFQTKSGEVVSYIAPERIFNRHKGIIKIKNITNMYLVEGWQKRSDADLIKQYLKNIKVNEDE